MASPTRFDLGAGTLDQRDVAVDRKIGERLHALTRLRPLDLQLIYLRAPSNAEHFARVTFLSDNRADLPGVCVPTLILQCAQDVIASTVVGEYVKMVGATNMDYSFARACAAGVETELAKTATKS